LRGNLPRGWLYAPGLSTRDIRAHLEEVYGLNVSADLISRVTDAVLAEVSDWQNRALETMYPIHCPAVVCLQTVRGFSSMRSGSKSAMPPLVTLLCNALPGSGKPSGQKQSGLRGPGRYPGGRT
jgi:hypothetical protein